MDELTALDAVQFDLGAPLEGLLAFILALMMFAVALGLKAEQFKTIAKGPKDYIGGVLAQIIGLPALTLVLCNILAPPPSLAMGMILVACCPGGNVSNILTLFGRGNTALSVSLTATSSLFAAFLTPISILFWLSLYAPTAALLTEIDFNIISFLIQTLVILALPVLLGMIVAWRKPHLAAKLQRPLAAIGGIGLIFVIIVGTYMFWKPLYMYKDSLIPLVLIQNSLAFALGFGTAVLLRSKSPERRSLTIEVGIQNSGLALVILVTQLGGFGGAVAVVGAWGIWHVIAGGAIVGLFRWSDRRRADV